MIRFNTIHFFVQSTKWDIGRVLPQTFPFWEAFFILDFFIVGWGWGEELIYGSTILWTPPNISLKNWKHIHIDIKDGNQHLPFVSSFQKKKHTMKEEKGALRRMHPLRRHSSTKKRGKKKENLIAFSKRERETPTSKQMKNEKKRLTRLHFLWKVRKDKLNQIGSLIEKSKPGKHKLLRRSIYISNIENDTVRVGTTVSPPKKNPKRL